MAASPALTPDSPYYLHPSDYPGLSICPVILRGENFPEWKIAMQNAFAAKNKEGFLDATIKEPADGSPEASYWRRVNSMLIGWITQSIEPSLRSSITYFSTVNELWEDLDQRFSIGNGPRIFQIRSEIARCHQEGQSVPAYFGRLKKLWDELTAYTANRTCTCGHARTERAEGRSQ